MLQENYEVFRVGLAGSVDFISNAGMIFVRIYLRMLRDKAWNY